jgi:hypothetical protein
VPRIVLRLTAGRFPCIAEEHVLVTGIGKAVSPYRLEFSDLAKSAAHTKTGPEVATLVRHCYY